MTGLNVAVTGVERGNICVAVTLYQNETERRVR